MTSDQAADPRGDRMARAVVQLADTLVHDFDVVSFLQTLSGHCVQLFGITSAGVMLQDRRDQLQVLASSDEKSRMLELMELQNSEGPCLDAYRSHESVRVSAAEAAERWPAFTASAGEFGFRTFAAVPMRLRDQTIGALNMFGDSDQVMQADDLRDAQALADIATIGLLNERALREAQLIAEQLQHALTSRVVLEQAKGAVASTLDCHVDDAFETLRSYARSNNLRLGDVARDVIAGTLPPATLGQVR